MSIPDTILDGNRRLMRVLMPASLITGRMHKQGIPLSSDVLIWKAEKWKERILEKKEELFGLVGHRFNLDSHEQLKDFLYGTKWNKDFSGSWSMDFDVVIDDKTRKITSGQYALAELHYRYGRCLSCKGVSDACDNCKREGRDRTDKILHILREIKLLRHRLSNFVLPFLDWVDCPSCVGDDDDEETEEAKPKKRRSKKDKFDKGLCPNCGGTGFKQITGHNPRYISIKNDWWWMHPTYLQTPNTLRFACVDRNIQQFARYLAPFDIHVRDVIVSPPGYMLWDYDYSKAERWGAAIIYQSGSLLEELTDDDAYAKLGSRIFEVPYEQCRKGSPMYPGTKTFVLSTQYQAKIRTIYRTVLQMCGIALSDDILKRGTDLIYNQIHKEFYNNVREHAWKSYQRGWAVSAHGALFRIPKDPVLRRYSHWTEIRDKEAWRAFERVCRAVSAFVIQSTMTGLAAQLMLVKAVDALDKWMKPEWSQYRHLNGNWDLLFPFITKHDELGFCSRADLAEEGMERLKKEMLDFNTWEPLLPSRTDHIKFPLKVEAAGPSRQFDTPLPKNHAEMTKAKNPNYYYQDSIMFKK